MSEKSVVFPRFENRNFLIGKIFITLLVYSVL